MFLGKRQGILIPLEPAPTTASQPKSEKPSEEVPPSPPEQPNMAQPLDVKNAQTMSPQQIESLAANLAAKLSGLPILQDESMDRQQAEFDQQNNPPPMKE